MLLCAASAWLATSVWAYRTAVSDGLTGSHVSGSSVINTAESTEPVAVDDTQRLADLEATEAVKASRLAAEQQVAEEARLAVEQQAAEEARLVAERQAAEKARLAAERQAAEEARLAVEQQVAEEARLAAEQQVAEEARLAAEQQVAEEARLAVKQQAAEKARLAAEQQVAEEARLAVEQQAAEEARLAVKQQAAEEARLAAEQQAAEEARLVAEQQDREAEQARQAALLEARRVSEATTRLSAYEQLRIEELGVLPGLSARLRFQGRSEVVSRDVERALDQIFDPLFLYSEMPVLVVVASNEYGDIADNLRLSRARAVSVVDYLVSRGLEPNRFRIEAENGLGLPYGTHHVKVFAEDPVE